MNHKPLQDGHYIKGPEPRGCYNTGVAPVIARSKLARRYIGTQYIVGRDNDVTLHLQDTIIKRMQGKPTKGVRFYKTATAAWREFEKRCTAITESNNAEIRKINDLKKRVVAGDVSAMLELGDYI